MGCDLSWGAWGSVMGGGQGMHTLQAHPSYKGSEDADR